MVKIVVGGATDEKQLAAWRGEFPEAEFVSAPRADDTAALVGADAYLGRIARPAFLAAAPTLRWVHSTGAGIETIAAIPELIESDVVVTNTRGGHAPSIAEHTFAMLLALTRRMGPLAEDRRNHVWKGPGRNGPLRELTGAAMTIVGMGNIGRAIAKRAVAFELRVVGVDAHPGPPPDGVEAVWGLERLDEAIARADVLVVAVPYTPETDGLIDGRRIGLLRAGGFVLAVSRGGIVDELALTAALHDGQLAGAGLDVFANEPLLPDDPLWEAPNLIITPHCSGASSQTRSRVAEITRENLRRFVRGEELANICDKRAGY